LRRRCAIESACGVVLMQFICGDSAATVRGARVRSNVGNRVFDSVKSHSSCGAGIAREHALGTARRCIAFRSESVGDTYGAVMARRRPTARVFQFVRAVPSEYGGASAASGSPGTLLGSSATAMCRSKERAGSFQLWLSTFSLVAFPSHRERARAERNRAEVAALFAYHALGFQFGLGCGAAIPARSLRCCIRSVSPRDLCGRGSRGVHAVVFETKSEVRVHFLLLSVVSTGVRQHAVCFVRSGLPCACVLVICVADGLTRTLGDVG
jgi:hypothetical protein